MLQLATIEVIFLYILEGFLRDNTFYFIERFLKSAYAKELAAKIII